jgi:hypothetical protein
MRPLGVNRNSVLGPNLVNALLANGIGSPRKPFAHDRTCRHFSFAQTAPCRFQPLMPLKNPRDRI